tara:strand:- start:5318 stop:5827 length:510 start_codon:yes stop_codon:yes gene_type:complete
MNSMLLERAQIVSGFAPISLTTARTGDVVSLKNYRRCLVLFHKGIGTAGDDPTITILQGTDIAFATNKALTFTNIYVKQDPTSLGDVGQWTEVTQSAANTYTDATSAERAALWAIEFKAEDLDTAGNYDCIRASIGDVGTNSQIGALEYILYDPIVSTTPADMPSAIID